MMSTDIYASHPNDRPNFVEIHLPTITIWFSYNTPIAFQHRATGFVARKNDWGPTTGRHLGLAGSYDKQGRIDGEEFVRKLNTVLSEGDYVIEEREFAA